MAAHTETAQAVAAFLADHPAVEKVHYPGQSGTMSFVLKGGYDTGKSLMDRVQLCFRAVSLGDVTTLIQHPASMTHRMIPPDEQARQGIMPGLIRLSVGLEHAADIIADLEQALA
jgi:methionine-gamma-lyase